MTPWLRRTVGGALAGATIAVASCLPSAPAQDAPRTHRVVIERFAFVPATITIRPGDAVEWINRDLAPHTATAADQTWDTGRLGRGETGSIVFTAPGRVDYVCAFHPHMAGTIVVSDAAGGPDADVESEP